MATKTFLVLAGVAILAGTAASLFLRREGAVARIEIFKAKRELRLLNPSGRTLRVYRVALGTNPAAPKEVEGDAATPEGAYFICRKNPQSRFFLSLGISYPGPRDAARGVSAGLISEAERRAIEAADERGEAPPWKTRLGGEVFIHGGGTASDWTQGCVALADGEMAELYGRIELGTPVTIHP